MKKSTNIMYFMPFLSGALFFNIGINNSFAQEIPNIVADSPRSDETYLPDFSYAGYEFGLGETPVFDTVINVGDHGAIPDDGKDDSAAILAALEAAKKMDKPVRIQFAAGQYKLSEILWIEQSNIMLAGMGSGAGGTQLFMARPLNQIDGKGAFKEIREYLVENDKIQRVANENLDVVFSEYSWTGGFIWTRTTDGRHRGYKEEYDQPIEKVADISLGKRGTKTLTLANISGLKAGDVFQIHWHNRDGEGGPLIKELYGNTKEKIGSRHWENPNTPLVRQATRIKSINGNIVEIEDPLVININDKVPAYFAKWKHLSNVGLQDFAMKFPENPYFQHHNESGFNGIYFTGVHNGWIKNVTITDSDVGILTDDLANVTIANIVTDGEHKAHYSVHVGSVHNVLVDNLQVKNPTEHTFSFNTLSSKSVYKNSAAWINPTLDQHSGANHQNLYDNITLHVTPDTKTADGTPSYELYKAGGAPYWWPGHGRYNTQWNINILVDGGVEPGQPIHILGQSEGPDSRIIGMHGNRPIDLDYRPGGYLENMNERVNTIPSLYDYQLAKRKK